MADLPKTPSRPANPKRCDGLIAQLAAGGSRAASIKRLQDAVSESLKGQWEIVLINHKDRLYELARTKPATQPTLRQAFDMARALEQHQSIRFCEIGAIVPGVDPALAQVYPEARAKSLAMSLGGGDHEVCSDAVEWSLEAAGIRSAWAQPLPAGGRPMGEGIVVAHPDTGYTPHPELIHGGRILAARGYDFEDDDADAADPLKGQAPGHGTATGSVLVSTQGDQSPDAPHFVSGGAPGAGLIPIRVSTGVVHLSFRRLVKAIYHAIDENADIISMSLGGPFYSNALKTAVDAAIDRGIIVIGAAGNVWPFVIYPAKLDEVVAVAASDCRDRPWKGSARGGDVDVSAPGESVWRARSRKSATNPFVNARGSGTSYATATTAAVCALWLAFHGRDNLIQQYGRQHLAAVFRRQLRATARTPAGWKTSLFGAGIVDAVELLSRALPPASAVLAATPAPKSMSVSAGVLELFPEVTKTKAKVALSKMWKCKPGQLDAQMAGFDQEFRYHLATNPELRTAILRRAMSKKTAGISAKTLARPELLGKRASRGLMKKLGM